MMLSSEVALPPPESMTVLRKIQDILLSQRVPMSIASDEKLELHHLIGDPVGSV